MKVECKISTDCKEPYAVLYIEKITPVIAEAISLLERAENGLDCAGCGERREYLFY